MHVHGLLLRICVSMTHIGTGQGHYMSSYSKRCNQKGNTCEAAPVMEKKVDLCDQPRNILEFHRVQAARGIYGHCRIGNRDVVGYGINGSYNYKDDVHFPFPAVRFKENTQEIIALREKEKGDWKMLCCEEKKALYRASFCQTFSEFQHPTGTWKLILGWVFFCCSFTCWVHIFTKYYVYLDPLPESLMPHSQRAQLRRMIDIRVNPIDGLTSQWDYDNDCWKWQKIPTPAERMENQK